MLTRNAMGSAKRVPLLGLVAAWAALIGWSAVAQAQPKSDQAAGYVVLPKVLVHTTGGAPPVLPGGTAVDTIIQMTNNNRSEMIHVSCFWVNANNHCGTLTGPVCNTNADCLLGVQCLPFWQVTDFQVDLTPGQPIAFTASSGLGQIPCDPLFPGPGCITQCSGSGAVCTTSATFPPPQGTCPAGQTCDGASGNIISAGDPFRGELKCVQVDNSSPAVPVVENDLKIEATIVQTTVPPATGGETTAAGYNGIGFQALGAGTSDPTDPICLGGLPPGSATGVACSANYDVCPGVLILNHFFEGATPEVGGIVNTDLTLVPCSEDLTNPAVSASLEVVAQMLIFNEFEQRFSSSARIACYRATTLADIDTLPGPAGDNYSIFSAGVQGTVAGQTRIRGVTGSPVGLGYGLLGVACENYRAAPFGPVLATTAFNLHHDGIRDSGDAVFLEP